MSEEEKFRIENEKLKLYLAIDRPCEICIHNSSEQDKTWEKYCRGCDTDNNNWTLNFDAVLVATGAKL